MPADDPDVNVFKVEPASVNWHDRYHPIDSETALYAVIGDPVAHSLSPIMHNAAFSKNKINAIYVALRVTDIDRSIVGAHSLGLAGISVTIPHKTTVIKFLDEVDPAAQTIGAVNTIVRRDGKLIGYNTDGLGAVRALAEKVAIKEKRVVVIGAGGAARAIGYAVMEAGGRITISNRSRANGEVLAKDLGAEFMPLQDFFGESCDVLINTTPVGMKPHTDAAPVDERALRPEMVVMDVVYNPLVTRFLQSAGRIGCTTLSGVDMFVYQGAAQFELWTNRIAPVDTMRSTVLRALRL